MAKEFIWGKKEFPNGKEAIAVLDEESLCYYALLEGTKIAAIVQDDGEGFDGYLDYPKYTKKGIDVSKVYQQIEYFASRLEHFPTDDVSLDTYESVEK